MALTNWKVVTELKAQPRQQRSGAPLITSAAMPPAWLKAFGFHARDGADGGTRTRTRVVGADGGTRTRTPMGQKILSLQRLPVPPRPHGRASWAERWQGQVPCRCSRRPLEIDRQPETPSRGRPRLLVEQHGLLPSARRLVRTVNATRPAARPLLAFQQFLASPLDATLSRSKLFCVLDPADELVAPNWRQLFP